MPVFGSGYCGRFEYIPNLENGKKMREGQDQIRCSETLGNRVRSSIA